MAEPKSRTTLIAGIFVLCGIVLLGGLVLEFGPLQHKMRKPYRIYLVFSDAQSLISGSPVRRAGAVIGKVATAPELIPDLKGVKVALEIYPEYKIPRGSPMKISSIGLMGDCAVDVGVPPPESHATGVIAEGETLEGLTSADLTATATKITDAAADVLKEIHSRLEELTKTINRLNTGVLSDENLKHLSDSLASLNSSLEKIDHTVLSDENTGTFKDSLALLKATMTNSEAASVKAESALAKMDKAMDQFYPGMKGFAGATSALHDAANALEALLKEARSGKGVLYSLLNDTGLRDNLERLIFNLRRHGLLFYKDREPPAPQPAPRTQPGVKPGTTPSRKR